MTIKLKDIKLGTAIEIKGHYVITSSKEHGLELWKVGKKHE